MLSINLTLIVQLAHFFIAWWLFDRIFFRHAYQAVLVADQQEQAREDELRQAHEAMRVKIEQERAQSEEERKYLLSVMPDPEKLAINYPGSEDTLAPVVVPDRQQEQAAQIYARTLVDHILNEQGE